MLLEGGGGNHLILRITRNIKLCEQNKKLESLQQAVHIVTTAIKMVTTSL
jgi:hypothetical protein